MNHRADERGGEEPPVVVRDRRRIDPETGAVRTPPDPAAGADGVTVGGATESAFAPPASARTDELDAVKAQLEERTADLQRITAEYANYRKRVDRDREVVVTMAKASVVADLLGVLDDLERAEAHGDLTGAFRAVADKLITGLQKAGMQPYGHEGEPFDPALHEAVQHTTSPDVDGPTVTAVLRRGYKFGERVLRPAMVAVTDHEPGAVASDDALIEPEPPGALSRSDGGSGGGSGDVPGGGDTATTH